MKIYFKTGIKNLRNKIQFKKTKKWRRNHDIDLIWEYFEKNEVKHIKISTIILNYITQLNYITYSMPFYATLFKKFRFVLFKKKRKRKKSQWLKCATYPPYTWKSLYSTLEYHASTIKTNVPYWNMMLKNAFLLPFLNCSFFVLMADSYL